MTAARTARCLEKVRFSSERDAVSQLLHRHTEARGKTPLRPLHLGENDRRASTRSMRSSRRHRRRDCLQPRPLAAQAAVNSNAPLRLRPKQPRHAGLKQASVQPRPASATRCVARFAGDASQPVCGNPGIRAARLALWLHQNLLRGPNQLHKGLAMLLWTPQAVACNGICIDFASINSIAIERRFKRSHTRRRPP